MGASSLVIYNVTKLELSFPLPTSLTCQTMSNDAFRLPHTPPYCQALGPGHWAISCNNLVYLNSFARIALFSKECAMKLN